MLKKYPFLVLIILCNLTAQDLQSDKDRELQQKLAELELKSVEVLDLRSALTIQEAELMDLKSEMDKLTSYGSSLEDSLKAKQVEIQSLKHILEVLGEDKKLSMEMVETIRSSPDTIKVQIPQKPEETLVSKFSDDSEFRLLYNEALNLYFEHKYQQSIAKFDQLLVTKIRHPLSDNCQYWLAECYYSIEQYTRAVTEFQKVYDLGDKNKADAAQFKIGMSYLKMGQKDRATSAFRTLEQNFPDSDLVTKANEYLSRQKKF